MDGVFFELWRTYKKFEKTGDLTSHDAEWWYSDAPPESFVEFVCNPGLSGCFSYDYDEEMFAWTHIVVRTAFRLANLPQSIAYKVLWDYPNATCAIVLLFEKGTNEFYTLLGSIGLSFNDFVDNPFTESELEKLVSELTEIMTVIYSRDKRSGTRVGMAAH